MQTTYNKVIVLLSTYNGEKYLQEQLESLAAQEDVEVEILARDDGSKDGTTAILNEWQERGLLKWYTYPRPHRAAGKGREYLPWARKHHPAWAGRYSPPCAY